MAGELVTIIICCHNRAEYLPQTLNSALEQRYRPVEILVVDDGSTDNTSEVIEPYLDRVRYYYHENKGVTKTRNIGCQLASGEYIAFLDDDDLMPNDRIEKLYKALQDYPTALFAVGDLAIIDMAGNVIPSKTPARKKRVNKPTLYNDGQKLVLWPEATVTVHTTLFRKRDGEAIGWFDESFKYASEDKDFFARLGLLGPAVYIPGVVSYYRRGHASLTNEFSGSSIKVEYSKIRLFEKHLDLINSANHLFRHRLCFRILLSLKSIVRIKKRYGIKQDVLADSALEKGLKLLSISQRIKFYFYLWVKMPVRHAIKGDA